MARICQLRIAARGDGEEEGISDKIEFFADFCCQIISVGGKPDNLIFSKSFCYEWLVKIGICLFLSMLAACNFTACLFPSLSVGRQWWWEEEMFDLKVSQACLV